MKSQAFTDQHMEPQLNEIAALSIQQGQGNSRLTNAQTTLQPFKGFAVAHKTHDPLAHVNHACLHCLEGAACKASHPPRPIQSQIRVPLPLSAAHRIDQADSAICFDRCWSTFDLCTLFAYLQADYATCFDM